MNKNILKLKMKTLSFLLISAAFLFFPSLSAQANVGLIVGRDNFTLSEATQNLYYGLIKADSNASSSFLLFQKYNIDTSYDDKFRVDSSGNITASGFIDVSEVRINGSPFTGGSSQWLNNVNNIYYNLGNVGIGTIEPGAKLDVSSADAYIRAITNSSAGYARFRAQGDGIGYLFEGFQFGSAYPGTDTIGVANAGLALFYTGNQTTNLVFRTSRSTSNILFGAGTGATANLFIKSDGNVGIGTTTPGVSLSVSNGTTNDVINVNGAKIAGLNANPSNPDHAVPLGYLQANYASTSTSLWSSGTGSNIYRLLGNVGIGTSGPSAMLELFRDAGRVQLKLTAQSNGTYDPQVTFSVNRPIPQEFFSIGVDNSDSDKFKIVSGSFTDGVADTGLLTIIRSTGNVGIGTNNPAERFVIEGGKLRLGYATNTYTSFSMYRNGVVLGGFNTANSAFNIFGGTSDASAHISISSSGLISMSQNYIANTGEILTLRQNTVGDTDVGARIFFVGHDGGVSGRHFGEIGLYKENSTVGNYSTYIKFANRFNGADIVEKMRLSSNGNLGIGTTTPGARLSVYDGTTNDVINVNGAKIGGLHPEPFNPDHAVPLGYLQANYSSTSTSFWSGSLGGDIYNANIGGSVGIGTASPSTELDVNGTITSLAINTGSLSAIYAGINVSMDVGSGGVNDGIFVDGRIEISNKLGIALTNPTYPLDVNGNARIGQSDDSGLYLGGTQRYIWAKTAGSLSLGTGGEDKLTINSAGNVGIGTSSPLSKLHISGGVGSLATGLSFGDGDTGIYEQSANTLQINIGGNNIWVINSSIFGGGNGRGAISASYPSLTVPGLLPRGNKTNLGVGGTNDNELTLITDGQNRLYVNSTGNIGIGTTTPGARLSVSDGTTNDVINVDGAKIGGLNPNPSNPDHAVPLAYLQANYSGSSLWAGSLAGNIYNANTSNVGIGTTAPVSKLHINGGVSYKRTAVNDADYTVQADDYIIGYTALSDIRTVTLPNSLCTPGRFFIILDESGQATPATAGAIIIDPEGATTIIGLPSLTINGAYNSVYVFCGDSAWYIL
jgi:hypothetical protein